LPSCQVQMQCTGSDFDMEKPAATVHTANHMHPCGVVV